MKNQPNSNKPLHRSPSMRQRRTQKMRSRRGAALLLCTLAATVLSLSAIAILRSHTRELAQTQTLQTSLEGRMMADGLLQRAIAQLRSNPNLQGRVADPDGTLPDAFAQLTAIAPNQTQIEVFLYDQSTFPAISKLVDPATL